MPEDQQAPNLHEVPLPTRVGASRITDGDRVIGPPSLVYPTLRDLANAPAMVTIEIDTKQDRFAGIIDRIEPARSTPRSDTSNPERLVIKSPPRSERLRAPEHKVSLAEVIAFRVLKIEVAELPATL